MDRGVRSRRHPVARQFGAEDGGGPALDSRRSALARPSAPRIWLILGDKAGDNAQVIIADALAGRSVKDLVFRSALCHGQAALSRLALPHRSRALRALEPPWPDLILTVGRPRPWPRWVWPRRTGRGRTSKRWLDRFDLVIAPPQFQVPSRPNVLHLDLPPLMRVDEAAVTTADAWRPRSRRPCRDHCSRCSSAARPSPMR